MIKHWWKVAAVLILLYVFVFGMIRPLNPGILEVTPVNINTGEQHTFTVNTYNTVYDKNSKIEAWLRLDSLHVLPSESVVVVNSNQLQVKMTIPMHLPINKKVWSYPLILNDAKNGAFVRPGTISITQNQIDTTQALAAWTYPPLRKLSRKDEMAFPFRALIYETIRNTFFHVPLWFGMVFIFFASMVYSVKFLKNGNPIDDLAALSYIRIGVLYGILGCVTGAIWAKNTWGTWWTFAEIKLNVSAIAMLIYLAYFVLRNSFEDEEKRARVSAVYSIFAFVAMVPLLFVIPRMVDGSLHPGNGGNPGFGGDDLDHHMKAVFYPAIIGFTLFGFWIANLMFRIERLWYKSMDDE